MHLSVIQWFSAISGIVGSWAVLFILYRRKIRPEFPMLSNYMGLYGLAVCVGLVAFVFCSCPGGFYQVIYWILSLLIMIVEFAVIYEVLVHALKPYSALIDLAKMLFIWVGVFLLFAAGCTALATSGSGISRLDAAVGIAERGIRLMQCGLLLFLLLFERKLGISWRNYGMGIAIGMGVTSAYDLIRSYLVMLSPHSGELLQNVNGMLFTSVLLFWMYLISRPEPARKTVLDSPSRLIFQRWNEVLMATPLVARNNQASLPVESFLPGVERAVERVMARKMAN
jgi:hypothetical protein